MKNSKQVKMHTISTYATRTSQPSLLAACLAASIATMAAACADSASSTDNDDAIVRPDDQSESLREVQAGVDVLLATIANLDDTLRASANTTTFVSAEKLSLTIDAVAQAAQALRDSSASVDSAVVELSMRTAQLAPHLRRFKRELQGSVLDAATAANIGAAIKQVQIAAQSLDIAVGELYATSQSKANRTKLGSEGLRNGPLFPGSAIYVLDEGHIDAIDAAFEDNELGIMIHDESFGADVERDPKTTVMVVKAAAKFQVPDARFAFIGPVNATAWILPENQIDAEASGVLWPGLSTAEIEAGVFMNNEIRVRFKQVIGPDGFSLFESPQDENTAPLVLVDSENGLPDVITVPYSTHKHANWVFESAGVYLVKVDVRGRLNVANGPWVTSSTATLKFVVLP